MARKYGKKASEKIGKTMHEFKRGKLKSGGSGKKVTSRKQAIAIGISQARRAGGKVPPPPRGHATMKWKPGLSIDEVVRVYLSKMQPGDTIDARGIARAIGNVDPLGADYALESAERDGLAVTSDGRWFGPVPSTKGRAHATKRAHAARKSPAQLDKEIAEFTAKPKLGDPAWEREWADLLMEKHSKARMPTIDELARAFRYIENEFVIKEGRISGEHWAEGLAFGRYAGDADDKLQAKEALKQLSAAKWLHIAERANHLAREQNESPRYVA